MSVCLRYLVQATCKIANSHCAAWTVSCQSRKCASEDGSHPTFCVQLADHIERTFVLLFSTLTLDLIPGLADAGCQSDRSEKTYLKQNLDSFGGTCNERSRNGRDGSSGGELGDGECVSCPIGCHRVDESFAHVVTLKRSIYDTIGRIEDVLTQKEIAKMGVTPARGGDIPRYILSKHQVYYPKTTANSRFHQP